MKRNNSGRTIIALIAAVLIISGCTPPAGRGLQGTGQSAGSTERPGQRPSADMQTTVDKSININTVIIERGDISSKLTLSGDVEASASVDVYPETNGELTAVYVDIGSFVRKDQVLAKVDPSKPGMTYAESPVEAPINGTVTGVYADPGATVGVQMPLVTIGDISRLIITTQVPERFIYMVEKGQRALISTTASPGIQYQARVTSVAPVVNPISRTLEIELTLIEKSPIKAGMFVGIELRTSTSKNSLLIPEKAVLARDEGTYVFRVKGDQVEKIEITTGIRDNGLAEITSGLSEGDTVALDGVTLLSDGSKVRILNNGDKS